MPAINLDQLSSRRQPVDTQESRRQKILSSGVALEPFFRRNRYTALVGVLLAFTQTAIALILDGTTFYLAPLLGMLLGAFLSHALFFVIHEFSHDLVFEIPGLNKLVAIAINLPLVIPTAISFRTFHLMHHESPGNPEKDVEVPASWELDTFSRSPWGKAAWLIALPVLIAVRSLAIKGARKFTPFMVTNQVLQLFFCVAIVFFGGYQALLYLLSSYFFALGLHPLGARWVQEHFRFVSGQPTYSYYGRLNALSLNAGFHLEHHDFPMVPWNRLRTFRKTFSEFYDGCYWHSSLCRLLFQFLRNPEINLSMRVSERTNNLG